MGGVGIIGDGHGWFVADEELLRIVVREVILNFAFWRLCTPDIVEIFLTQYLRRYIANDCAVWLPVRTML